MSKGPEISIIIPTIRPSYDLRRLEAFVARANVKEIVLVHQSGEPAPGPALKLAPEDHPVKAACRIIEQPGKGVSRARNAGVAACRGEILVFLDDDVEVHERYADLVYDAFVDRKADLLLTKTCYGDRWEEQKEFSTWRVTRIRDALGTGPCMAIRNQNVPRFHEDISAGAPVVCGGDSVFAIESFRSGKAVYRSTFQSVLHPPEGSTGHRRDRVYLASLAFVLSRHYGAFGYYIAARMLGRLLVKHGALADAAFFFTRFLAHQAGAGYPDMSRISAPILKSPPKKHANPR